MNRIEKVKAMLGREPIAFTPRQAYGAAESFRTHLRDALPVIEAAMELSAWADNEHSDATEGIECWAALNKALAPWQEKEADVH